ncbi:MAG: ATP-dependent DNA helicase RecQ [Solirubrobacteraceae bacterium]|nr:ATP-dependent DNA helicase RecQ [Solirubrobacteraceae bacterium]
MSDPALAALRALTADPQATFRPHQREAIGDLVDGRARVLCVQRTGWGKSAVYFVATRLLRDAGAGPTLIVSPLLALMRNQIAAAQRLGLRAHTINSTNRDEWDAVRDLLAADAVDLLLISPERLNNPAFRASMLPLFAQRVGLLVIDEAHCVSDWGHDFRPDYRRVRDMLAALPEGVAVLCTTATANDRVVADVLEQLDVGGHAELRTYRGPLARTSLRLEVVELPQPAARLAWLVTVLPELEGSGIVYTLTKRDATAVAAFLAAHGIAAEAYSGEHATEDRVAAEDRLLRGEVKALVATSALGMGYDKPDLGFVVHYQAPGSVIAYYQQVGRAGRGVDHADAILLRGAEDRRIQDFFIEQAFPPRERVEEVLRQLEAAGPEGLTTRELSSVVNLGLGRLEAMLKVLDVEGAVTRAGTRWALVEGHTWTYDAERYRAVTELRRAEQAAMAAYGTDGRCLMRTLQEQLDDPSPADCGRCAACTAPRFDVPLDPALVREATLHLRSTPLVLDVKKMAPDPEGAMRRIPEGVRVEEGRALARIGDAGWWPAIAAGLEAGRLDDEVIDALAALARGFAPDAAWVTWVPSRRAGGVLRDAAARLGAALGLPAVEAVRRTAPDAPPQAEMANAAQQVANVRGAFAVAAELPPGGVLLLDDRRLSGWTLAMVGGQLRGRGAPAVWPLALASAL